jgi:hypothetical protein
MKKKQFKKNYALTIIAVLFFATIQAQVPNAEGPPKPGYICRCGVVGYGCAGNYACVLRCSHACIPTKPKIISSARHSLSGIHSNSISKTIVPSFFLPESEIQKRTWDLEWGTVGPLNTALSEKQVIAKHEPGTVEPL